MFDVYQYVRREFNDPDMSNEWIDALVWGCTGYPCYFLGNAVKIFSKQIRHAKRALERGYDYGDIVVGEDNEYPNGKGRNKYGIGT